MSINLVILSGNLGKDADLRMTNGGTAKLTFSMATKERYKGKNGEQQEKTNWHNVVVWGQRAEKIHRLLVKGLLVTVQGKLETRSYEDKDGTKRYVTEVKADEITFTSAQRAERDTPPADEGPGYGGAFDDEPPF